MRKLSNILEKDRILSKESPTASLSLPQNNDLFSNSQKLSFHVNGDNNTSSRTSSRESSRPTISTALINGSSNNYGLIRPPSRGKLPESSALALLSISTPKDQIESTSVLGLLSPSSVRKNLQSPKRPRTLLSTNTAKISPSMLTLSNQAIVLESDQSNDCNSNKAGLMIINSTLNSTSFPFSHILNRRSSYNDFDTSPDDNNSNNNSSSNNNTNNCSLKQLEEEIPTILPDFVLERIEKTFQERASIHDFSLLESSDQNDLFRNNYGIHIHKLREWSNDASRKLSSKEEALQEKALAKARGFMLAIHSVMKIQAWYRMIRMNAAFKVYRDSRLVIKSRFFYAIKQYVQVQKMNYYQQIGKPFYGWRKLVRSSRRLRQILGNFFFEAVQKLTLNAQSIRLFFNEKTWGAQLSVGDRLKIRRLVLDKLFHGWRAQAKFQRMRSLHGAQILSRMIRRSRGPLWMKEAQLICFHMWYRYSAIRTAYRKNLPDPTFGYPYFPQWTKLMKAIISSRDHKREVQNIYNTLKYKIWFDRWKISKKRAELKLCQTNEESAIKYYQHKLNRRILLAWFWICRMKGKVFRSRNRQFIAWQQWAPRKRRLREYKARTIFWMNNRRSRRCFDKLSELFQLSVNRRIQTIKTLYKRMNDRKVLVCAYALLGKKEHMYMVDCWRRWIAYRKYCHRWRGVLLDYRHLWYQTRNKETFTAWKEFVRIEKEKKAKLVQLCNNITESESVVIEGKKEEKEDEEAINMKSILSNGLKICTDQTTYHDIHWRPRSSVLRFACLIAHLYYSIHGINHLSPSTIQLLSGSYKQESIQNTDDNHSRSSTSKSKQIHNQSQENRIKVQDQLTTAIEENNVPEVASAIENGAIVTSHHFDIATRHLNDSYFLLCAILLSGGYAFLCHTIALRTRDEVIMKCQSPVVAVMVSSHIQRWEKSLLTYRELSNLCDDQIVSQVVGGKYQSVLLWRMIVLLTIKQKKDNIKNDFHQTMTTISTSSNIKHHQQQKQDYLATEIEKRLMACHYRDLSKHISSVLEIDEITKQSIILPDMEENYQDTTKGKKIYSKRMKLSMEHTYHSIDVNMTSFIDLSILIQDYKASTECILSDAIKLRKPNLDRDTGLLRNGFIRQAHNDFLSLREAYKTSEQKIKDSKEKNIELKRKKIIRRESIGGYIKSNENNGIDSIDDGSRNNSNNNSNSSIGTFTYPNGENMIEVAKEHVSFINRTQSIRKIYQIPIVLETYTPYQFTDEEDSLLRQHTKDRLKDEQIEKRLDYCRNILAYVLSTFYSHHINIPYPSSNRKGISISSWIILSYLQNSSDCPQINNLWNMLPNEWWDIQSISFRSDREINLLSSLIESLSAKLAASAIDKHTISKQKSKLSTFITNQIKQISAVAVKQREKIELDRKEGRGIRLKSRSIHLNLGKIRKNIKNLKEEIRKSKYMFAANNSVGVFESFGESSEDRNLIDSLLVGTPFEKNKIKGMELETEIDSVKGGTTLASTITAIGTATGTVTSLAGTLAATILGTQMNESHGAIAKKRLEYASMILIESKRKLLMSYEQQLIDTSVEKKLSDLELDSYDQFCGRSNTWLQQLAQGKLLMVLDAYEVLRREMNQLSGIKKNNISDRSKLDIYQAQLDELRKQHHFFVTEQNRLEQIAEEVRFQELMRRQQILAQQEQSYASTYQFSSIYDQNGNNQILGELGIDSDFPLGMPTSFPMEGEDGYRDGYGYGYGSALMMTSSEMSLELLPPTGAAVRSKWSLRPGLLLQEMGMDGNTSDRSGYGNGNGNNSNSGNRNTMTRLNAADHYRLLAEEELAKARFAEEFQMNVLREYWHLAQPDALRAGPMSPILTARTRNKQQQDKDTTEEDRLSMMSSIITTASSSTELENVVPILEIPVKIRENNRLNNRTGRMWKNIGVVFLRMKEIKVREIIRKERQLKADARNLLFGVRASSQASLTSNVSDRSDIQLYSNSSQSSNFHGNTKDTKNNNNNTTTTTTKDLLINTSVDGPMIVPSRLIHLEDEVWLYNSDYIRLSISFSQEEHPDRLITLQSTSTDTPIIQLTPRGGGKKLSHTSTTSVEIHSRRDPYGQKIYEHKKAFVIPDPFVSSGISEFARIKASLNHKAGIDPNEGIPVLDVGILNSMMGDGGGTITPQSSSHWFELATNDLNKVSTPARLIRKRSASGLSLSRTSSQGNNNSHSNLMAAGGPLGSSSPDKHNLVLPIAGSISNEDITQLMLSARERRRSYDNLSKDTIDRHGGLYKQSSLRTSSRGDKSDRSDRTGSNSSGTERSNAVALVGSSNGNSTTPTSLIPLISINGIKIGSPLASNSSASSRRNSTGTEMNNNGSSNSISKPFKSPRGVGASSSVSPTKSSHSTPRDYSIHREHSRDLTPGRTRDRLHSSDSVSSTPQSNKSASASLLSFSLVQFVDIHEVTSGGGKDNNSSNSNSFVPTESTDSIKMTAINILESENSFQDYNHDKTSDKIDDSMAILENPMSIDSISQPNSSNHINISTVSIDGSSEGNIENNISKDTLSLSKVETVTVVGTENLNSTKEQIPLSDSISLSNDSQTILSQSNDQVEDNDSKERLPLEPKSSFACSVPDIDSITLSLSLASNHFNSSDSNSNSNNGNNNNSFRISEPSLDIGSNPPVLTKLMSDNITPLHTDRDRSCLSMFTNNADYDRSSNNNSVQGNRPYESKRSWKDLHKYINSQNGNNQPLISGESPSLHPVYDNITYGTSNVNSVSTHGSTIRKNDSFHISKQYSSSIPHTKLESLPERKPSIAIGLPPMNLTLSNNHGLPITSSHESTESNSNSKMPDTPIRKPRVVGNRSYLEGTFKPIITLQTSHHNNSGNGSGSNNGLPHSRSNTSDNQSRNNLSNMIKRELIEVMDRQIEPTVNERWLNTDTSNNNNSNSSSAINVNHVCIVDNKNTLSVKPSAIKNNHQHNQNDVVSIPIRPKSGSLLLQKQSSIQDISSSTTITTNSILKPNQSQEETNNSNNMEKLTLRHVNSGGFLNNSHNHALPANEGNTNNINSSSKRLSLSELSIESLRARKSSQPKIVSDSTLNLLENNFKRLVDEITGIPQESPRKQYMVKSGTIAHTTPSNFDPNLHYSYNDIIVDMVTDNVTDTVTEEESAFMDLLYTYDQGQRRGQRQSLNLQGKGYYAHIPTRSIDDSPTSSLEEELDCNTSEKLRDSINLDRISKNKNRSNKMTRKTTNRKNRLSTNLTIPNRNSNRDLKLSVEGDNTITRVSSSNIDIHRPMSEVMGLRSSLSRGIVDTSSQPKDLVALKYDVSNNSNSDSNNSNIQDYSKPSSMIIEHGLGVSGSSVRFGTALDSSRQSSTSASSSSSSSSPTSGMFEAKGDFSQMDDLEGDVINRISKQLIASAVATAVTDRGESSSHSGDSNKEKEKNPNTAILYSSHKLPPTTNSNNNSSTLLKSRGNTPMTPILSLKEYQNKLVAAHRTSSSLSNSSSSSSNLVYNKTIESNAMDRFMFMEDWQQPANSNIEEGNNDGEDDDDDDWQNYDAYRLEYEERQLSEMLRLTISRDASPSGIEYYAGKNNNSHNDFNRHKRKIRNQSKKKPIRHQGKLFGKAAILLPPLSTDQIDNFGSHGNNRINHHRRISTSIPNEDHHRGRKNGLESYSMSSLPPNTHKEISNIIWQQPYHINHSLSSHKFMRGFTANGNYNNNHSESNQKLQYVGSSKI